MKNLFCNAFAACLLTFIAALPASAQDLMSVGVGYYDINDNEDAADFRLEYRWDDPLIWQVKPWLGAEATSDGAVYAVGGVLLDMHLDSEDKWVVTPSFGAGLYGDGDGKDLGNTVEFRSQLELGYNFSDKSRLSIAGGHISNAGLGDSNPGTEIVNVYYHIPVSWIMGRASSDESGGW